MNVSAFDLAMVEVDQALMDVFGIECELITALDAEPIPVRAYIEQGLTIQQLGERGRAGNGPRLAQQTVGTLLADDAPREIARAILVVNNVRYKLTEPIERSGEIEYLLVLETPTDHAGSKSSTFLSST